jgi:hypothetical protein
MSTSIANIGNQALLARKDTAAIRSKGAWV